MTGTVTFKTQTFLLLSAMLFTTNGHLALTDIPKNQKDDIERDLRAMANDANDPFTTEYAVKNIANLGFEQDTTGAYQTPTFKCVRGDGFEVPQRMDEPDGEPIGFAGFEPPTPPLSEPLTGTEEPMAPNHPLNAPADPGTPPELPSDE